MKNQSNWSTLVNTTCIIGFIFIPYLIGWLFSLFLGDLSYILGGFYVVVYWTFGIGILAGIYGIYSILKDLINKKI